MRNPWLCPACTPRPAGQVGFVAQRPCHTARQAVEQYEAVKAREREQQEELDDARAAARAATLAFEELRQERTDLFMAAFQHVADTIDSVYTVYRRHSPPSLSCCAVCKMAPRSEWPLLLN